MTYTDYLFYKHFCIGLIQKEFKRFEFHVEDRIYSIELNLRVCYYGVSKSIHTLDINHPRISDLDYFRMVIKEMVAQVADATAPRSQRSKLIMNEPMKNPFVKEWPFYSKII